MDNIFISKIQKESQVILEFFKNELNGIRSNRPHPGFLENVRVEYSDSTLPIKQLASIQISPPASLIIQPWDKGSLSACEKGVESANLGVSVVREGDHLRVILPVLSAERREELIKLTNKKMEEVRVRIRQERDEVRKGIQKSFDNKEMGEDDKMRLQQEVQKIVDSFNKQIEELLKVKEEELRG